MSQLHHSIESIMSMLEKGRYTRPDIVQALADLEAMKPYIDDYAYKSIKKLLEDKL